MPRVFIPASEAFQRARQAVHDGDKMAARHWALVTLKMAPNLEDAWLILAAVASPRASLAYLERALELNPNSRPARRGLEWAMRRQAQTADQADPYAITQLTSRVSTQPVSPDSTVQAIDGQTRPNPALLAAMKTPQPGTALQPAEIAALAQSGWVQAASQVPAGETLPSLALAQADTQPVRVVRKKKRWLAQSRYKRTWGLLLISPWLVGLIIFKLAPLAATLGISFTNFFLLTPDTMSFVGLKNYIELFQDPNLVSAFIGTLKLALIVIPLQTVGAILLATLLSNEKLRLKDTLRVLFFIPSIIPSAAALFMWQGFTNPKSGWLNALLLDPLGLAKFVHFTSRGSTPSLLILSTLWSIGPGFLIITGAMQGIPTEVLEAALVDGANRLRRFFTITLPMVTPAIFFTLILNLTAVFGGAILLDRGSSFNSNLSSVDNYLYFLLFSTFRLGSAASLAWIFFIFLLAVVLVLFITSRRWVYFPDQEN